MGSSSSRYQHWTRTVLDFIGAFLVFRVAVPLIALVIPAIILNHLVRGVTTDGHN